MVAAAVLEGLAAAQTNALDQFVGRDLWKERLSSKEQLILNELVGDVPNGFLAVLPDVFNSSTVPRR